MNDSDIKVLHSIDNRLARVEERLKDLPEIKASLETTTTQLQSLKIKVATISGGISLAMAFLVAYVKTLFTTHS